jgi:hypothetical protein
MFEHTSRYYNIETATLLQPDGSRVAYKRRRFLPEGKNMQLLVEITVAQSERLDLVAARTLGDPTQFWRICDANNTMNPIDLTDELGKAIRVPIPQPE